MVSLLRYIFPVHRFKYSNKALKILIISDTIFFSGMALVEVVFSVFIVTNIPHGSVINLGVGNAIFMLGILISEPLLSKFYDQDKDGKRTYYGFLIGNLLKSALRLLFVAIHSVNMFYTVYFVLGIVHSIEYPAFSKLFTSHLDRGYESSDWGFKDFFVSLGKIFTFFVSGYIATYLGYNFLFVLSSAIMFISGVLIPFVYKRDLIGA